MSCGCNKNRPVFPNMPLVINNNCDPVLFHKATYKASRGTDLKGQPNYVDPSSLDYKNVLLVFEATNNAYLYSSDGIPTFISYVPTEQNTEELLDKINQEILDRENADQILQNQISANLEQVETIGDSIDSLADEVETNSNEIARVKTDLDNEAAARADGDTALQNAVNQLKNVSIQTDTAVSGDASTVTITKSVGPLEGEATETALPLPVADSTQAGVMNPATFNAVQENAENIDSILNGAVLIENLSATPTQDELTTQWKTATGKTALINRASIYDKTNGKIWYYYTNENEWVSADIKTPEVSVSQATNDSLGIVKGSTEDGQIAIEADGSMSMNGYDGITHDIDNLTQLVAGIEVPKLPASMVYDFVSPAGANNPSTADNANITARVVNTTTGAITNATLMMPMASVIQAGSVTAADKSKLDSLLGIKSLNDSLELDENGQLSVVGSGSTNLEEYTLSASNLNQLFYQIPTENSIVLRGNVVLQSDPEGAANLVLTTLPAATTTKAGLILPTEKTKLNGIPSLTEMQWTRVGNLPPAVVTGFEDTTYGADSITMHLDTKDLATGGVSVQELELDAATPNTAEAGGHAGLMSAFQATQLQTLAEGGAGGAEVLNEYGSSTTAALSQNFLTDKLNNGDVILGENASKASTQAGHIILGYGAKSTDRNGSDNIVIGDVAQSNASDTVSIGAHAASTQNYGIAIGYGAQAQASNGIGIGTSALVDSNSMYSIALGDHSKTTRAYEVSIGEGTGGTPTRYLANVRAGELDTDAVNVKQMEDYVAEHAGGGSSNILYSEYGTNTDGALTQAFVSEKLNGDAILLGSQATAVNIGNGAESVTIGTYATSQGNNSIAIGGAAKAGVNGVSIGQSAGLPGTTNATTAIGSNTSTGGTQALALGFNSKATGAYSIAMGGGEATATNSFSIGTESISKTANAIAFGAGAMVEGNNGIAFGSNTYIRPSNINSVAIGRNSITYRSSEVSIGSGGGNAPATRYLGNVTAGELDTDAVNVKQLRTCTIGDVLYASTEAASSITLSTPVSQYEKIEVLGMWNMPYTASTTPLQITAFWHINDQDNSKTFQIAAIDIDAENSEKTEVIDTWSFTNATTLDLLSNGMISGTLTEPTMESNTTPYITITKVIGIKAL